MTVKAWEKAVHELSDCLHFRAKKRNKHARVLAMRQAPKFVVNRVNKKVANQQHFHFTTINSVIAPIRPALCRKNADPFAWLCVSLSICEMSPLDKQISALKHFFSNQCRIALNCHCQRGLGLLR